MQFDIENTRWNFNVLVNGKLKGMTKTFILEYKSTLIVAF